VCRVKTRRTEQRIQIRCQFLRNQHNQHLDLVPRAFGTPEETAVAFSRWLNRFQVPWFLCLRAGGKRPPLSTPIALRVSWSCRKPNEAGLVG
jgi:hypothetical protein